MKDSMFRRVGVIALELLTVVAAAYFLQVVLLISPSVSYGLRSPTAAKECSDIREGMTASQVEDVFRRRTEPHELRHSTGQIISVRSDGACSVQLGSDNRVTQKKFQQGTEWEQRHTP